MRNSIVATAVGFAIVAAGIFLIGMGLYDFDRIVAMEAAGHVRGLALLGSTAYAHFGKWGVLALYSASGALVFVSGLDMLMKSARAQA